MFQNRQLVIHETMHGWLKFDKESRRRSFSFSIRASTPHLLSFATPRLIEGSLHLQDYATVAVRGELRLALRGPIYRLHAELPGQGLLTFSGQKTYQWRDLKRSLTTCPLTVYSGNQSVGQAEVVYRDSLLLFPLKALRLSS